MTTAVLLAQFPVAQWAIWLIIIAGVVAIALVAVKAMGIAVPPFVIQILWILFCVVIAVLAIKVLVSVV